MIHPRGQLRSNCAWLAGFHHLSRKPAELRIYVLQAWSCGADFERPWKRDEKGKKNIIVFPSHKCHTRPCTLPYDQYGLIHCVYLVCILYIVDDILCIILCHVMAFICRHIYIVYTVPLSLCTCVQISALVWSSFLCFSQTPLSKTSQGPNRNPKRLILGLSYRPDSCEPFLPGKDDVPSSPAQDRTVVSWMCF